MLDPQGIGKFQALSPTPYMQTCTCTQECLCTDEDREIELDQNTHTVKRISLHTVKRTSF